MGTGCIKSENVGKFTVEEMAHSGNFGRRLSSSDGRARVHVSRKYHIRIVQLYLYIPRCTATNDRAPWSVTYL
jgi:hypothetical protein